MANEFYKHLWEPKKTSRDWGTTEYKIIKNWTPRAVASTSQQTAGVNNQEKRGNTGSNWRRVDRTIPEAPIADVEIDKPEGTDESVDEEIQAQIVSQEERLGQRSPDTEENQSRTVRPVTRPSPCHTHSNRTLISKGHYDDSNRDMAVSLSSKSQQSSRKLSPVSEDPTEHHTSVGQSIEPQVHSQYKTQKQRYPRRSRSHTSRKQSLVSEVASHTENSRTESPQPERPSQIQASSREGDAVRSIFPTGSEGGQDIDVEMNVETESSEEDVEPLPRTPVAKKQRRAVAQNTSTFSLWMTRFQRTSRELNEVDMCLSLYDSTMRDAIENQDDVEMKKIMTQHWKLTMKYLMSTLTDITIVSALEKKHRQELAKNKKLQKEYISLLEKMRKVNGRYLQMAVANKQSRQAHMVELEQQEIKELSDMVSAHVARQNSHR